jgi:DNA-binding transcriptional MerR regulator
MTRAHRTDESPSGGYTIDQLAKEAGITIRAIRHYVTLGLLPPRSTGYWFFHYEESFRQRLLAIVRLRRNKHRIPAIRAKLAAATPADVAALAGLVPRRQEHGAICERWERISLRAGLELHLRSDAAPDVVAFARQIEALGRG